MKKTCLVVPSIREESFKRFIREWEPTGLFDRVDLCLIEDNPTRTFEMDLEGGNHMHLCWEDIDRHTWSWIIPRRSDTVRSFGYWWAWKGGYEYLMTLDDDCYPEPGYEEIDKLHLQMLDRTRWFNTLNNVRPRGTPYKNTGSRPVHINHGLWTNVLDYDAPQQLVNPIEETFTHDNRIVPHGAYFSFCGMNAMWRRESMVLSYHLLMGQMSSRVMNMGTPAGWYKPSNRAFPVVTLDKLPFDRFGDIWCGIISKRISDHLGWSVSSGTPYIHHDRASNPFTNLRKEANGIEVNETFWEKIDQIWLPEQQSRLSGGRPGNGRDSTAAAFCYDVIADSIQEWGGEHSEYWSTLGQSMKVWANLFTG